MKDEHPITRRRIEQRIMSRAALAKKAGVSTTSIRRAEAGEPLWAGTGHALARALGTTYEELQAEMPDQLPALDSEEAA